MSYFLDTHDKTQSRFPAEAIEVARRVVLVLVGLIFIFGIYALSIVWPSGWVWGEAGPRSFVPSHYLMMLIGVYATLGVNLIIASKNPAAHASLIWFTVWSTFVHSGIMAVQGLMDGKEHGHLVGDVPVLLILAIVLAVVAPRGGAVGTLRG